MPRHRLRRQVSDSRGVDLNPMMDIVFILLIFFIVTATFTVEAGLDVDKPKPAAERPPDDVKAILVEIDAGDEIKVAGRVTDFRRVAAALLAERARSPNAPVVLRCDPKASNGAFVRALDQARIAGAVVQLAVAR